MLSRRDNSARRKRLRPEVRAEGGAAADEGEARAGIIEFPSVEDDEGEGEDEEGSVLPSRKAKSGGFQSMGLSSAVYRSIMRKGYRVPTPIQRRAIPAILTGQDVVAMARTGSGATLTHTPVHIHTHTHVREAIHHAHPRTPTL